MKSPVTAPLPEEREYSTSYQLLDEAERRQRIHQSIQQLDDGFARRQESPPARRRFLTWFAASRCDAEKADVLASLEARGKERALVMATRDWVMAAFVYPICAAVVFVLLGMPLAARIAIFVLPPVCILCATTAALQLRQLRRTRRSAIGVDPASPNAVEEET